MYLCIFVFVYFFVYFCICAKITELMMDPCNIMTASNFGASHVYFMYIFNRSALQGPLDFTAIFKRKTHRHLLYHLMMMMHFCIFAFFVFLYFLYFCIFCIFVFFLFLYFCIFSKKTENFANQTPLLLSKPMTASTFGANDVFLATAPTGVFNREHR